MCAENKHTNIRAQQKYAPAKRGQEDGGRQEDKQQPRQGEGREMKRATRGNPQARAKAGGEPADANATQRGQLVQWSHMQDAAGEHCAAMHNCSRISVAAHQRAH